MLMLGATVLALEYDLLRHGDDLSSQARRIRIEKVFFLSGLLVGGIALLAMRRQNELRREIRMAEEVGRLRGEANTDPLTGLPNRRAVLSALAEALERSKHEGRDHAFFLLDLDGFKQVNDRWGHATGDHVLRLVVDQLRGAARPTDLLGRLGGDEFALLAYDVGREKHPQSVIYRWQRFAPIITNQCSNQVGVSIGVALLPSDGASCEEILAKADAAMYRAKGLAGRAVDFYQSPGDGQLQLRA
jgi:diguanylate cyclase (GGDEF)-like protein